MTKPRKNTGRELYGIIGAVPHASKLLKEWNAFFAEEGMDATMNVYPTTRANLPERLSEMFHFDRRAYIVGNNLSKAIIPLLDRVEPEARRRPRTSRGAPVRGKGVGWVENEGGVLIGRSGAEISLPHSVE